MKQIVVTISPDGSEIKIEALGYRGASCAADTKPLEDALGVVVTRDLKAEFHQPELPAGVRQGQR